ncbi:hypothetical protein B0O80DRAFT_166572 [Mortierella sp. GBAus27b]|nr:hypothetical protein B0O80DRAFT_166572 [Mortierella sp. GBAus27b]
MLCGTQGRQAGPWSAKDGAKNRTNNGVQSTTAGLTHTHAYNPCTTMLKWREHGSMVSIDHLSCRLLVPVDADLTFPSAVFRANMKPSCLDITAP